MFGTEAGLRPVRGPGSSGKWWQRLIVGIKIDLRNPDTGCTSNVGFEIVSYHDGFGRCGGEMAECTSKYAGVRLHETHFIGEDDVVEKRAQAGIVEFLILNLLEPVAQQGQCIMMCREIIKKFPGIKIQTYLLGQSREIGLIELRSDAGIIDAHPLQGVAKTFGNQFISRNATVVIEVPQFGVFFAVSPIEIIEPQVITGQRIGVVDDFQGPVGIALKIP